MKLTPEFIKKIEGYAHDYRNEIIEECAKIADDYTKTPEPTEEECIQDGTDYRESLRHSDGWGDCASCIGVDIRKLKRPTAI